MVRSYDACMKSKLLMVFGFLSLVLANFAVAAETYVIDPVHSSVDFKVRHLGISWVQGSFQKFAGKGMFDLDKPETSALEVTVEAGSITTGNEKRDGHLKSEDFFNAAKFPTLTFKSTKVVKKGEGSFEVTGDMTLLGVTKPLTFVVNTFGPVEGMQKELRRGGDTEFTIKRSDFGMAKMVGPIGDEVKVSLAFSAIKQ
jgi:polyisoprenoid-binding protein YceI